jgi:putative spermidine/putrescine transport system permease protein
MKLVPLDTVNVGLWIFFFGVLFFLLLPLIVVIPISFNPGTMLRFPPAGLSLRWYEDFFGDEAWRQAASLSVRLGLTVAVLASIVGVPAAVALARMVTRGKTILRALVLFPLIVPLIITAIAFFDVFSRMRLVRTFSGLVLAHTILAVPYVVIIMESALESFDVSLEEAAVSLGASRLMAFCKVTLPIVLPSLFASALFAFMTSWDDVVIVLFLGGADNRTLPLRMFEFLQTSVRPTIAAISSLLVLAMVLVLVTYQLMSRRQR